MGLGQKLRDKLRAEVFVQKKKKKNKKKKSNGYNRCLRTFGAWPLNIAASSNYGAKHKNGTISQPTWLGASDQLQQ